MDELGEFDTSTASVENFALWHCIVKKRSTRDQDKLVDAIHIVFCVSVPLRGT